MCIYIYIYNVGKLGEIIYSPVIYLASVNDAFLLAGLTRKGKFLFNILSNL